MVLRCIHWSMRQHSIQYQRERESKSERESESESEREREREREKKKAGYELDVVPGVIQKL